MLYRGCLPRKQLLKGAGPTHAGSTPGNCLGNPRALELMRAVNPPASLSLFAAVGLLWLLRMSVSEIASAIR
jgi:hypothetical protein